MFKLNCRVFNMLSKPQIWSFLEARAASLTILGTPRVPHGLPQTRWKQPNSSTIDFVVITFQTAFWNAKKSDFIVQIRKSRWWCSTGTESSVAVHLISLGWFELESSIWDRHFELAVLKPNKNWISKQARNQFREILTQQNLEFSKLKPQIENPPHGDFLILMKYRKPGGFCSRVNSFWDEGVETIVANGSVWEALLLSKI